MPQTYAFFFTAKRSALFFFNLSAAHRSRPTLHNDSNGLKAYSYTLYI